ncbi:hypothetical protein Tco_0183969 [Tanacetum coccineum]
MGNRIRTRNSPDILLGMILQFEFLSKSVLKRRQNARMSSTHVFLQSIPSPIRRSLQQDLEEGSLALNCGVTSASHAPKTAKTTGLLERNQKELWHLAFSIYIDELPLMCSQSFFFEMLNHSRRQSNQVSFGSCGQAGLGGYDWSNVFEVEQLNYAFDGIIFSSSHQVLSDNEVKQMMQTTEKPKSDSGQSVPNPRLTEIELSLRIGTQMMRKKITTRLGLHRHKCSDTIGMFVLLGQFRVSTARPVCTARPSVSTARPVCTARPSVSTARPIYATRPIYTRMDNWDHFMLKKVEGNPEDLLRDLALVDSVALAYDWQQSSTFRLSMNISIDGLCGFWK